MPIYSEVVLENLVCSIIMLSFYSILLLSFLVVNHIWDALLRRLTLHKSTDVISDVYDGKEYKRHSSFLSSRENVSLLVNTDGVALFAHQRMQFGQFG